MKKFCVLVLCTMFSGIALTACGSTSTKQEPIEQEATEKESLKGALIENQSFDVNLAPIGDVTFASYEPNTSKEPFADAIFEVISKEKGVQVLEGMNDTNIRSNEVFHQVEAVSFTDYNLDNCKDIILICSYSPSTGEEKQTQYSEVRYYSGNIDGKFMLEKEMSQDANAALSKITIQTAKLFVNPKDGSVDTWRQALVEYLKKDSTPEQQEGYSFIYMDDDDVPELVEIGNCEAIGTRIVHYDNIKGKIEVTQLQRRYFTYIERENLLCNSDGLMDDYYDLVYSIIGGKMTLIASGYYGADDYSNIEFDTNGEPIYQYKWEGVLMTKEEYKKKLNEVYDQSKAKESYEWNQLYTRDEIIELFEQGNLK